MMITAAVLALTMAAAAPIDVKGKWEGTISGERPDGTTNEDTALLILTQKEAAISGSVGGSETDQHPITSGTIEGNKVTLLAKHAENGREYRLELTVDGDQMKGTLTAGERRAKIVLKKRKD